MPHRCRAYLACQRPVKRQASVIGVGRRSGTCTSRGWRAQQKAAAFDKSQLSCREQVVTVMLVDYSCREEEGKGGRTCVRVWAAVGGGGGGGGAVRFFASASKKKKKKEKVARKTAEHGRNTSRTAAECPNRQNTRQTSAEHWQNTGRTPTEHWQNG